MVLPFCSPWTPEEDAFLKEVVEVVRTGSHINWTQGLFFHFHFSLGSILGELLGIDLILCALVAFYVDGRSTERCRERWETLTVKTTRRGKWTTEEDEVRGSRHLIRCRNLSIWLSSWISCFFSVFYSSAWLMLWIDLGIQTTLELQCMLALAMHPNVVKGICNGLSLMQLAVLGIEIEECTLPIQTLSFEITSCVHVSGRWANSLDKRLKFGNWKYKEDKLLWLETRVNQSTGKCSGLHYYMTLINEYQYKSVSLWCVQANSTGVRLPVSWRAAPITCVCSDIEC